MENENAIQVAAKPKKYALVEDIIIFFFNIFRIKIKIKRIISDIIEKTKNDMSKLYKEIIS